MPSVQAIALRRSDTIDIACELLLSLPPGTLVWLLLPWRMPMASSPLHLRRLARAAEDAAIDLRVVSPNVQTRLLAREARIPAYAFLPPSLWRLRRSARRFRETFATSGGTLSSRAGARPLQGREGHPVVNDLGSVLSSLMLTAFLLLALAVSAATFMPSATVTLSPVVMPVAASFAVTARPGLREIDYGKAIIPARRVQVIVSGHGSTPASGWVDVPDAHASGEVVFANRTSEPVHVPKGTIVRTSWSWTIGR